ncbi:MAG: molybdenum cofactor guanylyltransferase MobA [Pseudomonadota bacterium]
MTLPVTTVVLAGGLGTRMGGNKGLQLLRGRALIDWVLDAVRDSDELMINANDQAEQYALRGFRIIADRFPDWPGPLAGVHAALFYARHDWVATVPCDAPLLPHDVIARLCSAVPAAPQAAIALADGQRQPTIALYRRDLLPTLEAFLHSGGRKMHDWHATLRVSEVVFDDAAQFININTPHELLAANGPR